MIPPGLLNKINHDIDKLDLSMVKDPIKRRKEREKIRDLLQSEWSRAGVVQYTHRSTGDRNRDMEMRERDIRNGRQKKASKNYGGSYGPIRVDPIPHQEFVYSGSIDYVDDEDEEDEEDEADVPCGG